MRLKVFEIQNNNKKTKHNKMLSNEYSPMIFDAETKRYSTFLDENKFEENIARNIQNSNEPKNKRTNRILNIILIVVVIVAIVIICV